MDKAKASVQAPLDLLQEEVGRLIELARQQGAEAYRSGDTRTFEQIDRLRPDLEAFGAQVDALARQWSAIGRTTRRTRRKRASTSTPRPKSILPEQEYVLPILQVLHDAGGSAHINDVKVALERMIGPRLRPQLPSQARRVVRHLPASSSKTARA